MRKKSKNTDEKFELLLEKMKTGRRKIENWSPRVYQLSAVLVIFCR